MLCKLYQSPMEGPMRQVVYNSNVIKNRNQANYNCGANINVTVLPMST